MKSIFDKAPAFFIQLPNSAKWGGMILIGVILLIGRSADPIYNPAMYTEDGAWLGMAYTSGWLNTLLNAKDGYFVWGNVLLLGLASVSSKVICGSELICLPQSVAFYSYLFFSVTSTIAFFVTKSTLPIYGRWIIFIWILLIPLGDSSNEIIGRLSNIGYFMVLWCVLLVYYKSKTDYHGNHAYADIGLVFAAITNPFCIVLVPILAAFSNVFQFKRLSGRCIKDIYLKFRFVLVSLLFIAIYSHFHFLESSASSVTGSMEFNNLIEVGIARSILYPFIFTFYSELNDLTVLAIFIAAALFGFISIKNTDFNGEVVRLVMLATVALLLFLVATLVFRQSLTQQLGDYSTTFPDRYFMGLNVLVILIFSALATGGKVRHGWVLSAKAIVSIGIIAQYLLNLGYFFEYETPRKKIVVGSSFLQTICEHRPASHSIVNLPIYFKGWKMSITSVQHEEAMKLIDCASIVSQINDAFFLTNDDWVNGIARERSGFFTKNTPLYRAKFKAGKTVSFANDDWRAIVSVVENGPYLNVWVDGEILNPEDVGLPSQFEVKQ